MRFFPLFAVLFLSACATVAALQLDDRFGRADPARFDAPPPPVAGAPDYWREVRPILDQRCVSCHACYDAPCQLNLTSYAGVVRGANPRQVYGSNPRLLADRPTRLGFDAQSTRAWRDLDFFPVLNEREQSSEANRIGGVMYRLLTLKQANPGPRGGRIDDPDLDFSLDRSQLCVAGEGLDQYERQHPTRGMPFGLPALAPDEHRTLSRWLEAGAPYRPPLPPAPAVLRQIDTWETFFNADDLKSQLTARYLYEHWFIGHIWFAEQPGQYFELVRSTTPPGQPIDVIATRRPFDDPGVGRVWYRLRPSEATPLAKTLMPLLFDAARLQRLRDWFITPPYTVSALPDYAPERAANPFVTFRELPLIARYRLLLDEAQFTIAGFMKGPVCRGQVALNSINDHFWVFFVSPNEKAADFMAKIIDAASPVMTLPAERESTASLLAWREYARLERQYTEARSAVTARLHVKGERPLLTDIWDGDGRNANATLTIFRHFDSASVVKGLAGERPQTAFVMGYPVLERMHYLLTAGFDVFGNVGHQLATRLYMDFLRMESELNFLALLPIGDRQAVLDRWYRQRSQPHNEYLADAARYFPLETGIRFRQKDTLGELYGMLRKHTAKAADHSRDLENTGLPAADIAQLQRLSAVKGLAASSMPEDSLLLVTPRQGQPAVIALVRNSAHTNVAELFNEEDRRLPQEDTLLALGGAVGAYPNALFAVDSAQLPAFADAVRNLDGTAALTRLVDRFGVRRSDPRFWAVSDTIHARQKAIRPLEYGILDYSRLENR